MRPSGDRLRIIFFLVSFLWVGNSGHGAVTGEEEEAAALLSIKSGFVDPLGALRDWKLPAGSRCNWTGVRCNPAGEVESLDLSGKNLSGRILVGVQGGALPRLASLNLRSNSFASALPASFSSNLTGLRALDLSDNMFSGRLPPGFGGWPRLTSLNASGNNFVGPLPVAVANATSLQTLDLRGNFFEGSFPAAYGRLPELRFLGLSGNNLTGRLPPEIGLLTSVATLILGYNGFEGDIPPEMGNLTSLRYLDLAVGYLGGIIPPEIGNMTRLHTLYLFKNSFEGGIPMELGNLSSLALLDLSDNRISGDIPAGLAKLGGLQLLSLMCNRLTGPLPAGLGELTRLEVLELWNNSLTGALPPALGRNSPLQWLDVSSNALSGGVPAGLCDGGNLTKLILFGNAFAGPFPAKLSSCVSLVRVRAQRNRLNGTIPAGLGRLPRLQRLELADNDLGGQIPGDIASSVSLSFVDFSGNRLQLSLPSGILSIPTIQSFIASGNELDGEIPHQYFQDCRALEVLDLSNNRLSGDIPASLASCKRLVNLNLRNNKLAGEIPDALATMPALAVLDLSVNNLTGAIPPNFGSSPALEMLNVSYNNLRGPVPANGLLRTINPGDLVGNPGLCGGALSPCSGAATPTSPETHRRTTRLRHILTGWAVGISVVLATAALAAGARRVYLRWNFRRGCYDGSYDQEIGRWPWSLTAFQRLGFTSSDVLACIKEANVVGMGATGVVYRAELQRPHTVVAVKKLWRGESSTGPPGADIGGEVSLLGRLRHRNIVRLLGHLHNDADTMLIYEYMPNGSLWEALHGERGAGAGRRGLLPDWVSRYNVAAGVAQGLAYLHHDCRPPVIHRDVKSSNILLDANLDARLADFGLARAMPRRNETVSKVAGSYGYIAPEYAYSLKVDERSDIYSYGVVLMELLTGRRPAEAEFGEGQDIVSWVRDKLRKDGGGVEGLLDPDAGGRCEHVQEEMLLVLRVAVLCTARSPGDRPSMRDVLSMLGEAKPRRKSSGTSAAGGGGAAARDRPVFSASPNHDYL